MGQAYLVVPPTAKLSFSITVTEDKKATQKVYQNGELVSQQTDTMTDLPTYAYGTNECFLGKGGDCGSLDAYSKLPRIVPFLRPVLRKLIFSSGQIPNHDIFHL